MPATRISARIYHVGFVVENRADEGFLCEMLGFTETWRGGANPKELSWINMKVPDGEDYVELMLYHSLSDTSNWWGTKNHLSLVVPDIEKSVAELESRPYYKTYGETLTIHTGVNGKRQVNLYDPDRTRVEIMEPKTVTGKPVPLVNCASAAGIDYATLYCEFQRSIGSPIGFRQQARREAHRVSLHVRLYSNRIRTGICDRRTATAPE